MSAKAEELKNELKQLLHDDYIKEHGEPPKTPITLSKLASDFLEIIADDDEEICKEAFPTIFARELEQY
ncbi:MAG: hypothetical protein FWG64_06580 [Firmicutes bacterium]|nr:hypothetical protein [Bacillota bacterium]